MPESDQEWYHQKMILLTTYLGVAELSERDLATRDYGAIIKKTDNMRYLLCSTHSPLSSLQLQPCFGYVGVNESRVCECQTKKQTLSPIGWKRISSNALGIRTA